MTDLGHLEQGLRSRLWVIDIPICYREEFITLVSRWCQCSGVEWTIKRLKSLKVDLYRRRAKLPPLSWVRKNRRGDIAGCIGGLFRWADKSDSNFRKVVQSLMCYTVFTYSKASKCQLEKFSNALKALPPRIDPWFLDNLFEAVKRNFGGVIVDRKEVVSHLFYRGSPTKRKPSRGLRSCHQDKEILSDADFLLERSWGISLTNQFRTLFEPVFEGLEQHPISSPFGIGEDKVVDPWQVVGGKIAFLQEPGGKLRSVASPLISYQLALQHFGKSCYRIAGRLPWDCTHDQSVPIPVLQECLRQGTTVHSVDLSSATDYFPLEVQLTVMRALYGKIPDLDLFEIISRSTWISPIGPVHWNRGQPLGLYPSFAVFTVTHGFLLWFLNGCRWHKDFYVLGDDVVILNDKLYRRYIETLNHWACPHSPEKSLSSDRICEFAGKVITSELAFPQYKWKEMSNDNFIDIARQLGHRSRILLSPRQKAVFDKVQNLCLPYGLNFSFEGSNLLKMIELTEQVFGPGNEKVLESLMDLASVVNRNIYDSSNNTSQSMLEPTTVNLQSVLNTLTTFDEKVRMVLRRLLPWYTNQDPKLFAGVPGGLGCTELPPASLPPSRLTTLDRYERLLGYTTEYSR